MKKGFTLLELLVVILIIGILAAIALPQYRIVTLKAQYARAKQTAGDIRRAYELYYAIHDEFPTKFSDLEFANKFDESNEMKTENGYSCRINTKYNEFACNIGNDKLRYFVNFYTNTAKRVIVQCRTSSTNTSSIYHRVCQQETGKTAEQSHCIGSDYCYYLY